MAGGSLAKNNRDCHLDFAISCMGANYSLEAVVEHMGASLDNGHYVARVWDKMAGHWTLYNDENVTPNAPKPKATDVYIAFYTLHAGSTRQNGYQIDQVSLRRTNRRPPSVSSAAPVREWPNATKAAVQNNSEAPKPSSP